MAAGSPLSSSANPGRDAATSRAKSAAAPAPLNPDPPKSPTPSAVTKANLLLGLDVEMPPPPAKAASTGTLSKATSSKNLMTSSSQLPPLSPKPGAPPSAVDRGGSLKPAARPEEEDSADIMYTIDATTGANVLKAASEEKLVEKLTEELTEVHFIKTFLATYQSFMTPIALLNRLIGRYLSVCAGSEDLTDKRKAITMLRVFSVLKMWVEGDWDDFADESMKTTLVDFIANKIMPAHQNAVQTLKRTFEKKRDAGPVEPPNASLPPPAPSDPPVVFMEVDLSEFARHFSLVEQELYATIKRKEFLRCAWSKTGKEINAPNILRMIDHTNQVIFWVTTEIVSTLQMKPRVQVLTKFIQLAQKLMLLNNFNGVKEMLAALNSSPVRRLKNTWAELSEESQSTLKSLEALMSHESSFKNYRTALRQAQPPAVPYLGTYLTDVTFIEDGNKAVIDGLIHWYKWQMMGKVITQIQSYQTMAYAGPVDRRLYFYCKNMKGKGVSEAESYNLSLKVEPRDTSEAFEKMLMEEEKLRKEIQQLQVRNSQLEEEVDTLKSTVRMLQAKIRGKSMRIEEGDLPPPVQPPAALRRWQRSESVSAELPPPPQMLEADPLAAILDDLEAEVGVAGTPIPTLPALSVARQELSHSAPIRTPDLSPRQPAPPTPSGATASALPPPPASAAPGKPPPVTSSLSSPNVGRGFSVRLTGSLPPPPATNPPASATFKTGSLGAVPPPMGLPPTGDASAAPPPGWRVPTRRTEVPNPPE
jgi:hypothetical protein